MGSSSCRPPVCLCSHASKEKKQKKQKKEKKKKKKKKKQKEKEEEEEAVSVTTRIHTRIATECYVGYDYQSNLST